jgi:hypothetical protein
MKMKKSVESRRKVMWNTKKMKMDKAAEENGHEGCRKKVMV